MESIIPTILKAAGLIVAGSFGIVILLFLVFLIARTITVGIYAGKAAVESRPKKGDSSEQS